MADVRSLTPNIRKRSASQDFDPEDEYVKRRLKNNEAVNRTRQKKKQEEEETAKKVEELRTENEQLERKVESLQKELAFLKEMFVTYANHGAKRPISNGSAAPTSAN